MLLQPVLMLLEPVLQLTGYGHVLTPNFNFPKFVGKSGGFKRRELCAYLELGKVLGHYDIVLLEICLLPRFFL